MDKKEEQIMQHYKSILENKIFDEYDIFGFLIFIRRHIEKGDYKNILEFSHLIAHRERDRGKVKDAIITAIENDYQTDRNGKTLVGYQGMDYTQWVEEWKHLGEKFDISIDIDIIEEITLCVFSLAQFACYVDKKGSGRIELFIGKDGNLALVTTEGKEDSLYVCYSTFGNFIPCREIETGHLVNPVEAVRVNGILRLKDLDGYII